MSEAYAEFQSENSRNHAAQLCFILFLLLGQLVALLAWRLVAGRGKGEPTWWGRFAFVAYLLVAQVALFLGWRYLAGWWHAADKVLLADVVTTVHFGLVLAVLLVLLLLPVGLLFRWGWTRNFWLRLAHLVVIEIVAGQAVVGIECPLTTLERNLRGGTLHGESDNPVMDSASPFGRFCHNAVFFPDNPTEAAKPPEERAPKLITPLQRHVGYVTVAVLVLLAWLLIPAQLPWRGSPPRQDADKQCATTATLPAKPPDDQ